MSRGRRIALSAAGIGLAFCAVVAAGTFLAIRSEWFRGQVHGRIVYELEKASGGRVELAGFTFDSQQLAAGLSSLVIHGNEAPSEPPLLQARTIIVRLKIVSLLKRNIDIESLLINGFEVNLIVQPDGRTNIPEPAVGREKNPMESLLDLAIHRTRLENGTLHIHAPGAEPRQFPLNIQGEDLRAHFFYSVQEQRYSGDVSFRSVGFKPGNLPELPLSLKTKLAFSKDLIEIEALRIGLDRSSMDLQGTVRNIAAPRTELAYTGNILLEDAAPFLPAGLVANHGELRITGRAELFPNAAYTASGRVEGFGLVIQNRSFRVDQVSLSSGFDIKAGQLALQGMTLSGLGGTFSGNAEVANLSTVRIDGSLKNIALKQLALAAREPRMVWDAAASGTLSISGKLRNVSQPDFQAKGNLLLSPAEGDRSVAGQVDFAYDGAARSLAFGESFLTTRSTQIQFRGKSAKWLELHIDSRDPGDIEPVLAFVQPRLPGPLPLALVNGRLRFDGAVAGLLENPVLEGRAALSSARIQGRHVESLQADLTASSTQVAVRDLDYREPGFALKGSGQLALFNWKPAPFGEVSGNFFLQTAELAETAAGFGYKIPGSGQVSAEVKVSGAMHNPRVSARFVLMKGDLHGQPFDQLSGEAVYRTGLLEVASARIEKGQSRMVISGSFVHPERDWSQGQIKFDASLVGVHLNDLPVLQRKGLNLRGRAAGRLAGKADLKRADIHIRELNGKLSLAQLAVAKQPLGELELAAASDGALVRFTLNGRIAGAELRGTTRWLLKDDYPAIGDLTFSRIQLPTLVAQFQTIPEDSDLPFEGFAEGKLSFSISAAYPRDWRSQIELSALEIRPSAGKNFQATAGIILRNEGPILLDADAAGAMIRQARLTGKDTDLSVSGMVALASKNPWDIRFRGNLNVALLRDFEPRLAASGNVALDASLRGPLLRPDVYGRVEVQNTSLHHENFPNGIDNANGLIFLYRDRAIIENLTAETGGGKLDLGGFVNFGPVATYSLWSKAAGVRVRYPEGVSTTVNAALSFTGTAERSVLGGDIVIMRMAFQPQVDLGSVLAATSRTFVAPADPNRFLQGMRFDVRVATSPEVVFETPLARSVQGEAELRLRGDPLRPILLGRVLVNRGEVTYFGTRYTIDSGDILFANPARIEPVVNLNLQTRVRGVEVALNINGPLRRPDITYRSDPPLPFAEIVALLATGRTPAATPGLTNTRTELSQSWEQVGATGIMNQVLENPMAGRLERFFGVSRMKIDPSVRGVENTPEARLSLEQQITQNLTLTYITNLARAQEQTIRVEWDVTKGWSAVALREPNGLFGIDFLYKKRFK